MINCRVCDSETELLTNFENFPLSSEFVNKSQFTDLPSGQDLYLLICQVCGHMQLGNEYNVNIYNSNYSYRESQITNNLENNILNTFDILYKLIKDFNIKTVLEYGANNLSFLSALEHCQNKIAVDPILETTKIKDILCFNSLAEDFDENIIGDVDLFISRHNLEHIFDPNLVLQKINGSNLKNQKKYFFVEVPDADKMIMNNRVDQVFFDHIHYFFEDTLENLFFLNSFDLVKKWKNNRYGGSLCYLFSSNSKGKKYSPLFKKEIILKRKEKWFTSLDIFLKKCENLRLFMENNYGNCYGYGAGHSTPFLAYHTDGRFHHLEGIYDDDESKYTKKISGIIAPIINPKFLDKNNKILITSTDHTAQIIKKLPESLSVAGLLL